MAIDSRITIRLEANDYDRLNRRRFDLKLTWQSLCLKLLEEWFQRTEPQPDLDNLVLFPEKNTSPPLQNSDTELTSLLTEIDKEGGLANQLAAVLRSGNEKAIAIITGAIEVAAFRVERDDLKSGH